MKTVLLVDDNLTILRQISMELAGHYRAVSARSGAQALTIARKNRPDIILLDIDMPEMNGFETIAAFKKDPVLARIPVIFLTASHDTETQVKALKAGGVDFIRKTFEREVFLHRIDLHLQLAQYQNELEDTARKLQDTILTAFAELLERRDGHSGGHVERTRKYMSLLGRLLLEKGLFEELTAESVDLMARASLVHDIGKIGISDSIMLKQGRLTAEEFEMVKRHTTIGARTMRAIYRESPMPLLHYAALMAGGHHESYDGRGYPGGLKGDDIPLCCRMLALVNVYDALTTDTVYRPARTADYAARVIAEEAGRQFDPRIVEVFLANQSAFAVIAAMEISEGAG